MKFTGLLFALVFCTGISYSQTWDIEKLKEYKIENADLIVEVRIMETYYMTDVATYICEVVKIKKGNYNDQQLSFDVSYAGATKEIETLRMEKLNRAEKNDVITLAFRKHDWLEGMNLDGKNYAYFMTE